MLVTMASLAIFGYISTTQDKCATYDECWAINVEKEFVVSFVTVVHCRILE